MKKINVHFLIFLLIAVSVSISDIVIYFLNCNFIITNSVMLLLNIVLLVVLKKKGYIEIKSNFSKFDFIFILGLLLYMLFSIPFPDLSWDTRSYHIYIQENVFADKLNFDFFAGRNLNSFLFALGDRINYLFRYVFGYRFGTIISYYLILILYYQVKKIIKEIINSKNEILITLFSIFPCVASVIFSYAGTYYIDNFGLVCLMECLYILLFEKEIFKEKIKAYTLAIIVGIAFSVKITNIIFIIPMGLYYIFKNFKGLKFLKLYDWVFLIFLAIMPWGIYAICNYIQTGNPIFPYYNSIFNSEYFMATSWKDDRFGPKSVIQFLIWPIYIIFNPEKAFDTKFVDIMWGIGFSSIALFLLLNVKKRKKANSKIIVLSMITLISYYLWEALLVGYVRYASIVLVLSYIVVISIIFTQFEYRKWISISLILLIVGSTLPSCGYDVLVKIKDYNSISELVTEYKLNLNMLFKDKDNNKTKIDGILGAINDDSLIPSLIKNENKIYNLEERMTITNEKTRELYNSKIENQEIFVIVDKITMARKKACLIENNFEVLEEKLLDESYNFLSPSDTLYVLKVMKK